MEFLKNFGANRLVVFSPSRSNGVSDAAFQSMCECYNQLGEAAGEMGFSAGLHNHLGQMVQDAAEIDRCMALTDPKLFSFSPDTAHLYLAGVDVMKSVDKHKQRLMLARLQRRSQGGREAARQHLRFRRRGYRFPGCHRVLKSIAYKGWICVDLDTARNGPRASYERCGAYVVDKLEPIYV